MLGAISKRDILAHPVVTIQCFGWRVFLQAVMAQRGTTFLSLLVETEVLVPRRLEGPELVGRAIELERRAQRIYEKLAARFTADKPVAQLLTSLARQEQQHAELLAICQRAISGAPTDEARWDLLARRAAGLERQMDEAQAAADSVEGVEEALRLVLAIESSEINRVFRGIVTASDSDFVRKLAAFQQAGARHIDLIRQCVPKLAPALEPDCHLLGPLVSDPW